MERNVIEIEYDDTTRKLLEDRQLWLLPGFYSAMNLVDQISCFRQRGLSLVGLRELAGVLSVFSEMRGLEEEVVKGLHGADRVSISVCVHEGLQPTEVAIVVLMNSVEDSSEEMGEKIKIQVNLFE
jgi:hypothetical protein